MEAKSYPWSALGRVNTGGRGYCTGVLIGERHVLSQARCLYNAVEGRWWDASELHFVAGYERDSYRGHAAVADYRVAPGFAGGGAATLANLVNNWALITLGAPLGREAGWMAVQWLDAQTKRRLERGEVNVLDAGYRRGQPHVVTLVPSCRFKGLQRRRLVASGGCQSLAFETELATLLFVDGELRVLGSPSMRRDKTLRRVSSGAADQVKAQAIHRAGNRRAKQTIRQLFANSNRPETHPGPTFGATADVRQTDRSREPYQLAYTAPTGGPADPIRLAAVSSLDGERLESQVRRKPVPFVHAAEIAESEATDLRGALERAKPD